MMLAQRKNEERGELPYFCDAAAWSSPGQNGVPAERIFGGVSIGVPAERIFGGVKCKHLGYHLDLHMLLQAGCLNIEHIKSDDIA